MTHFHWVIYALQKFSKQKKKPEQLHENKCRFVVGHFFVHFLSSKVLTLNRQEKAQNHTQELRKTEVIEKWKHPCILHSFSRVFLKRQGAQTQFRYFCSLGQISLFPLTPSALQLPTSAEELALHIWLELQPKAASNWISFYLHSNFFCGISAHLGQVEQKYWEKEEK